MAVLAYAERAMATALAYNAAVGVEMAQRRYDCANAYLAFIIIIRFIPKISEGIQKMLRTRRNYYRHFLSILLLRGGWLRGRCTP